MSDGRILGPSGSGVGLPGASTQFGTPPPNNGLWTYVALPAAASAPVGAFVYTTDQGFVYSNGVAWVPFGGSGSGSAVVNSDGTITVSGNNISASPLNVLPGIYTYGTLPVPSSYANKYAVTTDVGPVFSNGVVWQILYNSTTGTIAISSNTPLPQAQQSSAYSVTLNATSGIGTRTWFLVSSFGATNTWTLNAATGALTGTPGALATDNLMIQVSDSTGAVAQKLLTIQTVASLSPAATPTFSPAAGNYTGAQSVTISCSTGSSTIYYTTNGSTPTPASTVYTTPVVVSSALTLKAIATAAGFTQSAVGSAAYTFNVNPMGLNFAASGGPYLDIEDFPIFQDMVRSARAFTKSGAIGTAANLDANGWPTEDFCVVVHEGGAVCQQWMTNNTPIASASQTVANPGVFTTAVQAFTSGLPVILTGTAPGGFSLNTIYFVSATGLTTTACELSATNGGATIQCTASAACSITPLGKFEVGFTGVGTAGSSVNCNISNIVTSGSGATMTTTFDLQPTSTTFAFQVTATTGSVGCQNVFCYLPAYRAGTYSSTSLFTTESVAFYKKFGWIRDMFWKNAWNNTIANNSTTRRTPTNCKTNQFFKANLADGYPLDWMVDFLIALKAAGGATGIWHCHPVQDDGTYAAADITTLQRLSAGIPIYVEIGNELWNGNGAAGGALRALSVLTTPDATFTGTISGTTLTVSGVTGTINSGGNQFFVYGAGVAANTTISSGSGSTWTVNISQTVGPVTMTQGSYQSMYRCLGDQMHTLAAAYRTAFGSRFGTDVKMVACSQQGANGCSFLSTMLTYMNGKGYTVNQDVHYLGYAPYINLTSPTFSWTVAQIETNLTSGTGNSVANVVTNAQAEHYLTLARYFNMNGVLAYEGGWQTNTESSSLINGGAAAIDSGMQAVESTLWANVFNSGCTGISRFEGGAGSNGGNLGCIDELHNNFLTLTSGSPGPRTAAMQTYMPGTYVGTKNVVSGSGSTFSALNYVDYTGATYPVMSLGGLAAPGFQGSSGLQGAIPYIVNCTVAGIYSLSIDFTNTIASAANCNVRLNGTTVFTGTGVVPGTGTNGGVNTVTLTSLTLSKGFHELTVGPFSYLASLSMTNLLRFT